MAEAILSLAAAPTQSRNMGLAGRQCIELKFNRSAIAADFEQLLEKVNQNE